MTHAAFPEVNTIFAAGQPEYRPLPAHADQDDRGTTTFCWRLTWRERFHVLLTGVLWHQVLTFRGPLQPQALSAEKPVMARQEKAGAAG